MNVALIDKPKRVQEFTDTMNESPLMIIQSTDFPAMLNIYQKMCRVKALLDEIAEEFVDAKSVRMLEV